VIVSSVVQEIATRSRAAFVTVRFGTPAGRRPQRPRYRFHSRSKTIRL